MTRKIFIISFLPVLFFTTPVLSAAEGEESETGRSTATLSAASVSASTPAATGDAPPLALQPGQAGIILSAREHLSALLSRGALLNPKELDSVLAETAALDIRITTLLGPAILNELETRRKERGAETELRSLRALLIAYYGDNEGKYPASPKELIPKYLADIPELELPDHARTAEVKLNSDPGATPEKAVTDSGGWLYFSNPASPNFGMLIMNCSHKNGNGHEYYKY